MCMTAEQVRHQFNREGISISEWAKKHGVPPRQVFEVLAGRNKGNRGRAHDIAVLLRMKRGTLRRRAAAHG
ncbi:MAG: DNA-binding protein [Gammaproteobacteria bacterium]